MKKITDDIRLMIKVCDLYYNQNINQQKIAEMLSISRPVVSQLLTSAKEAGIVRISVADPELVSYWETEEKLKRLYSLQDVIVTKSYSDSEETKKALGYACGRYLEHKIKSGDTVGISMGSTLYNMLGAIKNPNAQNVTFVPLIGGMGKLRTELHSNSIAENLSRIYNGSFVPMYAPARVANSTIRKRLMKEESLVSALGLVKNLNIAVVGIGYPNNDSSIKTTGYFKENEIESLLERGVAGELCMQFYDIRGDFDKYSDDNNVIGIELAKLKKIPCSVGVAGGIDKVRAIRGAIAGRYINVLITDKECAEALLKRRYDK